MSSQKTQKIKYGCQINFAVASHINNNLSITITKLPCHFVKKFIDHFGSIMQGSLFYAQQKYEPINCFINIIF